MKHCKYYIAFSIHGTNAFIIATVVSPLSTEELLQLNGFRVGRSRRPNYKPEDGVKLLWDELLTKEGKPLRSVPMILNRFKKLEAMGWKIDKEKFMQKHYGVK